MCEDATPSSPVCDDLSHTPAPTLSLPLYPEQHTDLEVCALEIARLQEGLEQERARAAGLAYDLQAKHVIDQLDQAIAKSEDAQGPLSCRDGWNEFGGPFLLRTQAVHSRDVELRPGDLDAPHDAGCAGGGEARQPSLLGVAGAGRGPRREAAWQEARQHARDKWDDEKATLLLQVLRRSVRGSDALSVCIVLCRGLACLPRVFVCWILLIKVLWIQHIQSYTLFQTWQNSWLRDALREQASSPQQLRHGALRAAGAGGSKVGGGWGGGGGGVGGHIASLKPSQAIFPVETRARDGGKSAGRLLIAGTKHEDGGGRRGEHVVGLGGGGMGGRGRKSSSYASMFRKSKGGRRGGVGEQEISGGE